jgi:hypothetical protein
MEQDPAIALTANKGSLHRDWWIIDSGANLHVCNDKKFLDSLLCRTGNSIDYQAGTPHAVAAVFYMPLRR